jgi:hypothetical protein
MIQILMQENLGILHRQKHQQQEAEQQQHQQQEAEQLLQPKISMRKDLQAQHQLSHKQAQQAQR